MNPLLLSAAGSLAKFGASTIAQGIQEIGGDFASFFSAKDPASSASASWPDRLTTLASQIRQWLGEASQAPFRIKYSLSGGGQESIHVDGTHSEQIQQFFRDNPSAADQLRKIANEIEQTAPGNDSALSSPTGVAISIDQTDWSISLRG